MVGLILFPYDLMIAKISIGMKRFPAGRMDENPSVGLSGSLRAAGFKLGRLQTGTPARILKSSIDFTKLAVQHGDINPSPFSFINGRVANAVSQLWYLRTLHDASHSPRHQDNQIMCYQTTTTPVTHDIIRENMHLSVHIQETRKGQL